MPRSGIDGYMTTLFLEKTLYFEIILDLQKSYKDSTENSCILHQLPLMLTSYINHGNLSKLGN